MTVADDNTLTMNPGTGRRHEAVRNEVIEMHLFDENAAKERARCGRNTTPTGRMGVREYVNDRLYGNRQRPVCQDCKALAMPLAEVIIEEMAEDLEDEDRLADTEDCRELLNTLAREMEPDRGPG